MVKRGPYVTITDRRCLATLLGAEKRRRGWNQVRLGNHLRVQQGDISKLLRCQRARLPIDALRRIAEFLPQGARTDLQGAVLSAEGREVLRYHEEWLSGSLRPYEQGAFPGATDRGPEAVRFLTGQGKKTPSGRVWNDRGWGAIVAYNLLSDDFEAGQEIREFEKRAARLGFTLDSRDTAVVDRMWLAIMRVFEPTADNPGTVELGWQELQYTGKLLAYLKAAFKRELILLKRPSDLERAQQWGALEIAAKNPPRKRW